MRYEIEKLIDDVEYDMEESVEMYKDYIPKKMSKREFVREMLRLQEERSLYQEA